MPFSRSFSSLSSRALLSLFSGASSILFSSVSARSFSSVLLHTETGRHPLTVRLADTFISRFVGLMLAAPLQPDRGLLITACSSVHTCFMRQTIDIIYLDDEGCVTKCVPAVKPWRGSSSRGRGARGERLRHAFYTLELAAGTIDRLRICAGDQLQYVAGYASGRATEKSTAASSTFVQRPRRTRQTGSAMIEFAVVGPLLTLLGLSLLQYGMLFFSKNQFNHAGFMAARAGSTENAKFDKIQMAYAKALVPLYGGGTTAASLDVSYRKAFDDVQTHAQIEILNPTVESFTDFNDPTLQASVGMGKRVIPNASQIYKAVSTIGANSGQNIQDANLLKLRVTMGFKPQVPLVGKMYTRYLKWMDDGTNAFNTAQIADGRIPVVSHVMVQMQSDAIEGGNVSSPGMGNGGAPVNSGTPPVNQTSPPECGTALCTEPSGSPSGGPGSGGGSCPVPVKATLSADTLFAFDQSTLQPAGIANLDALIASAKSVAAGFESINVSGFTDPLGTDAHNLALSQARANTVSNYLSSHGVTATHVNVVGKGSADLIVPLSACVNQTGAAQQACLAPNRRVEVELNPKAQP